jgi:RNA polymerase sigma-70 factor, ECF subfamily
VFGDGLHAPGTATVLRAQRFEHVFREQYGRAVAVLVRVFGGIDMAEEAVQVRFGLDTR